MIRMPEENRNVGKVKNVLHCNTQHALRMKFIPQDNSISFCKMCFKGPFEPSRLQNHLSVVHEVRELIDHIHCLKCCHKFADYLHFKHHRDKNSRQCPKCKQVCISICNVNKHGRVCKKGAILTKQTAKKQSGGSRSKSHVYEQTKAEKNKNN